MLSLPLRVISHLQLPQRRKIEVSLIFLLGGLYDNISPDQTRSYNKANSHRVTVAGIVRLATVYPAKSSTSKELLL